jgi:hypothetical protein
LARQAERGAKEETESLEQLGRRLDALDRRLDDIDSMVSAIAERAMNRPLSVTITCPNCGRIIEIGMVGSPKMMK